MPDHHPITLVVGGILTAVLFGLVFFGLSCSAFHIDPSRNSWAELFNNFANEYKLCK